MRAVLVALIALGSVASCTVVFRESFTDTSLTQWNTTHLFAGPRFCNSNTPPEAPTPIGAIVAGPGLTCNGFTSPNAPYADATSTPNGLSFTSTGLHASFLFWATLPFPSTGPGWWLRITAQWNVLEESSKIVITNRTAAGSAEIPLGSDDPSRISITGSDTELSFLAAGLGFSWNDTVETLYYADSLTTFDLIYNRTNNSYSLTMSSGGSSISLIPSTQAGNGWQPNTVVLGQSDLLPGAISGMLLREVTLFDDLSPFTASCNGTAPSPQAQCIYGQWTAVGISGSTLDFATSPVPVVLIGDQTIDTLDVVFSGLPGAALIQVTNGSVMLNGTLTINLPPGAVPIGDSVVIPLIEATAGIGGGFSEIVVTGETDKCNKRHGEGVPEGTRFSVLVSAKGCSGGLSGGAIAGIVVGSVVGLAICVGILLFLLYRRNRGGRLFSARAENAGGWR